MLTLSASATALQMPNLVEQKKCGRGVIPLPHSQARGAPGKFV
jgi:hypothetical protein